MWLSRPLYESLPYLYMAVGVLALGVSFFIADGSGWWLLLGALLVIGGLVLWLRRRDYRTMKAEYQEDPFE